MVRIVIWCCALTGMSAVALTAGEHHGQVKFGGSPVLGASVTITQGNARFIAVTDQTGRYSFPELNDGLWTIQIEMLCFVTIKREIAIGPSSPAALWELEVLGPVALGEELAAGKLPLKGGSQPSDTTGRVDSRAREAPSSPQEQNSMPREPADPVPASAGDHTGFRHTDLTTFNGQEARADSLGSAPSTDDLSQTGSDALAITGSVDNLQGSSFGNNLRGAKSEYHFGLGVILDNSALDARPFSLTGQALPKTAYNDFQGVFSFGGPLKIPYLRRRRDPNLVLNYQTTRNRNSTTQSTLVPTLPERAGDFSQATNTLGRPVQFFDPTTGVPFPGNVIPTSRLSQQALALLNFYPLPNFDAGARYNYETPLVGRTSQDSIQTRIDEAVNAKNQIFWNMAFQRASTQSTNLFGFRDTTGTSGIDSSLNWWHRLDPRLYLTVKYEFSRLSTHVTPYFANRQNVSGEAGITGNNQDALNWGPPSVAFSSGIANLTDAQQANNRNQTSALSFALLSVHRPHNITYGGDFRRQEFNYLSQQDPRGTFTFTGQATQGTANGLGIPGTGSDLADFLLGIPDTSSIAFGNADKYFRQSVYDAYVQDDWRVSAGFTVNVGLRWEYQAPITEKYGRLVNLDVGPGFSAAAPVLASDPVGPISGQRYPDSLLHPDKQGFEPRIGIAWHPMPGSSLIVRGGYGVYYNTSMYQTIAAQMAQQSPLSKSLVVANSAADPLNLANGFNVSPLTTPTSFAVDPNLRVGFVHNWQVSVQRALPSAFLVTATYLGIKGTRALQEFLPNTFPSGALNPCPACPVGYVYEESNGNSTREAGQIQLQRRFRSGFSASAQYTFSKALDDAALGGRGQAVSVVAQNWLDLAAERGPSSFDQRHLFVAQFQYSTGVGVAGGSLLSGWRGRLLKNWTFVSQITAGSGLPETPVDYASVSGTGVTGSIRPNYTGAPLYSPPSGLFLNPAALAAPSPGQWGNAGRDSIVGPGQFSWNASIQRTFRLSDRRDLSFRADAMNVLNHVTYSAWNTTLNSAQFGLPTGANSMRSVRASIRLRF